ncbi:MAG: hypothetical protein KZY61_12885 [Clostridiaceae bacterium]|nr:hypothetical protein [Clostridiaceae bacterium]MBW4858951.1 hypothetical protein [Clostridiaceae bacterium]MBW4869526.1 hypothetical protein [Clostridiaceae bacterium]
MNKDNEKQLFESKVIDVKDTEDIKLINEVEDMDDSFWCCIAGGGKVKE